MTPPKETITIIPAGVRFGALLRDNKYDDLTKIAEGILAPYAARMDHGADVQLLCGTALGWELACINAALNVGIHTHIFSAFPDFHAVWPPRWRQEAENLLDDADEVTYNADRHYPGVFTHRDKAAVSHALDRGGLIIAPILWDGTPNAVNDFTTELLMSGALVQNHYVDVMQQLTQRR